MHNAVNLQLSEEPHIQATLMRSLENSIPIYWGILQQCSSTGRDMYTRGVCSRAIRPLWTAVSFDKSHGFSLSDLCYDHWKRDSTLLRLPRNMAVILLSSGLWLEQLTATSKGLKRKCTGACPVLSGWPLGNGNRCHVSATDVLGMTLMDREIWLTTNNIREIFETKTDLCISSKLESKPACVCFTTFGKA